MIDVLISLLLTTSILLSLLSFQIVGLRSVHHDYLQTIALVQLTNFSEMIRATHDENARQVALSQWNRLNKILLPKGAGFFILLQSHECKINIRWLEKQWQLRSLRIFC